MGLSVSDFWDLTVKEILNVIKEYNKKEENKQILLYILSIMLIEGYNGKLGKINDYFPNIKLESENNNLKDVELKKNMLSWASAINKTRKNKKQ